MTVFKKTIGRSDFKKSCTVLTPRWNFETFYFQKSLSLTERLRETKMKHFCDSNFTYIEKITHTFSTSRFQEIVDDNLSNYKILNFIFTDVFLLT